MTDYGAPERKFHRPDKGLVVSEGHVVEGYASLFGKTDQGGDIVQKGAYAESRKRLAAKGSRIGMLVDVAANGKAGCARLEGILHHSEEGFS